MPQKPREPRRPSRGRSPKPPRDHHPLGARVPDGLESAPMVNTKSGPGRGGARRPAVATPAAKPAKTAKAATPAKGAKLVLPPEPESSQTWTGRLQIQASPDMVDFLNRLGARPDRGRSPFSLTNVMRRQFELFMAAIDESDPRISRGFPQEYYDLTIELVTQPWTLNADALRLLEHYLGRQPHLNYLLEQIGADRKAYLAAIAKLNFSERLHLIEQAHIRHAPPPPEPGSLDL